MVRSAEGPTNEAQEEGNNSVKAQLRGETRCGPAEVENRVSFVTRCGTAGAESSPPLARCAFGGGHARNRALFIISGSGTREVGEGDSDVDIR